MTIIIELILKFGSKVRNLSTKTYRWVDHLWTQLLLAQTQKTQKRHICTRLLLVWKHQTPSHKQDQQKRQHTMEKRTFQRTQSQDHYKQIHHWSNLIPLMTANKANLKSRDGIKRKSSRNLWIRNHQTHRRVNLIFPTKVIIKVRDAIIRRAIRKRTLWNYAQR